MHNVKGITREVLLPRPQLFHLVQQRNTIRTRRIFHVSDTPICVKINVFMSAE